MLELNTPNETGLRQAIYSGTQLTSRDRFDPASGVTVDPLQTVEPFLDCAGAAVVLGGLHSKTVERWAREGRIPAYRYFRHWKFRASELEVWMRSHVNSVWHPCRLKQENSGGT